MPTPPPRKHRPPVIRQLSLQNQTSPPSTTSRGLKKQLSEDDSRVLEAVGVTAQGWNAERPQLRIGSGGGKIGPTKITGTRPKPVKVAWADKKPECPAGVEVIATKCQGQPRPSVKNQRLRSPLLGSKDTLVYTRLQLAERLRNAWSEREKIKPNINIFLARAPDTTRSESNEPATDRPTAEVLFQDTASAFSDSSAPLDKKRKSMKVRTFSQEFSTYGQSDAIASEATEESRSDLQSSSTVGEEKESRRLQELNKIEIRMTKIEGGGDGVESKPLETDCRDKTSPETDGKDGAMGVTAEDRRANFRRSSILHKTITESFSGPLPEKSFEGNAAKAVIKPKKPPLIRAFSAPSQNDQSSDINKAANQQKKVKMIPQRRLQPSVSFDLSCTSDDPTASRDRIKSAPVRRRLKSATARRKNKDKDSSDEEKEPNESTASKKTTRRSQLKKGADIITMVSLVSPAASDTEDSLINLPMESWRGEEKSQESPHSTKSAPANGEESRSPAGALQKFVSLRKTTKSVTFQPHPVLARGYSASFPSRRAPAGTPIIVPTPVVSNPALTPAQLLEREKRAAVFSGINADGRGVKRRLLRSSSEFPKRDYPADDKSREETKNGYPEDDNSSSSKDDADDAEEKTNGEPEFKCQKERDCWNLYQKMVEKGVSVSFDTVLRGMLTPTEYRLRKNHLLSNF